MTPDFDKAAVKAAETLIKYGVKTAPVSPLAILESMDNVILSCYSEMCDSSDLSPFDLTCLFSKGEGAFSSVHTDGGRSWYVVAYNNLLPYSMVQQALARELGHIVLRHEGCSDENRAEAVCFAHHLLCPRPLIHSLQVTNMRLTTDVLANLTGVFHQCLACLRKTPGTIVPATMNRLIRSQFMPFVVNFFEYYTTARPEDGSALADFGSFMDLYEE